MARYKADNGKIVDTDKMDYILDLSYEGCYGCVDSSLYRTKKSHTWYLVRENSWQENCSISCAEKMALRKAAAFIMEHRPGDVQDYPELEPYIPETIDE